MKCMCQRVHSTLEEKCKQSSPQVACTRDKLEMCVTEFLVGRVGGHKRVNSTIKKVSRV